MNYRTELEKMTISDLRMICRDVGIQYGNKDDSKSLINKLLKPFSDKKYRMDGNREVSGNNQIVRYVKKVSNLGIDITFWMMKWVQNVTNIVFPGRSMESKIARKFLYLWGITFVIIQMYYFSQMGSLAYEMYWSKAGDTVQKAIGEIISNAIVDIFYKINAENAVESISCALLQPEDTQELLDFIRLKSLETKTKTMEIINDRIAMLDDSIPAEYWEKQELLTLPNYENYINLAQNAYKTISNRLIEKLQQIESNQLSELPAPTKRLALPAPNPCDPYTPGCEGYKKLFEDFYDQSRKYTKEMLDKVNPVTAGRRHCVRNIKYVISDGFNNVRKLPDDLIKRAKYKSLQQQNKYNNLKDQQQNTLPFLQLWAMILVFGFIIQKIFGLNRNGNRNNLTLENQ
jgi:hypothetical protein